MQPAVASSSDCTLYLHTQINMLCQVSEAARSSDILSLCLSVE